MSRTVFIRDGLWFKAGWALFLLLSSWKFYWIDKRDSVNPYFCQLDGWMVGWLVCNMLSSFWRLKAILHYCSCPNAWLAFFWQRPQRGQSSVEHKGDLFVSTYIHPRSPLPHPPLDPVYIFILFFNFPCYSMLLISSIFSHVHPTLWPTPSVCWSICRSVCLSVRHV